MEKESLELAIAELDTKQLARDLQNGISFMQDGPTKETICDLLHLAIKQKELISILRRDIKPVWLSETIEGIKIERRFYPMSTQAKPKSGCDFSS